MNTEDENKLNEFEKEWIEGETEQPKPDAEALAVVEAAQAEATKAADDYVQAHADLEGETK